MFRFLALAALAAGCASPGSATTDSPMSAGSGTAAETETPAGTAPDSAAVRIALGDAADVGGVPVRFVSVVEDSRCPPDVSCVWAGRARVQLEVGSETVVLAVPSGMEDPAMPSEATVDGLTVRVAALAGPAPSEPGPALPMWVEVAARRAAAP